MGENSYCIRPAFQHRFKPAIVKGKIYTVLKEELTNKFYDPEEVPSLTRKIAEAIKTQVKECAFQRYKLVVQVVIGEQRGEGVKCLLFVQTLMKASALKHWFPFASDTLHHLLSFSSTFVLCTSHSVCRRSCFTGCLR
ncbi:dynein light chain Tctex-type protein 2B isoform X1 [Narcine bancroftii]|uniref:dynein light chain Tctex-type protein 2B isoform X1 n=1 Tax=Narcine bancroftii TaxID=1343680 RepID=UPI0038310D58